MSIAVEVRLFIFSSFWFGMGRASLRVIITYYLYFWNKYITVQDLFFICLWI